LRELEDTQKQASAEREKSRGDQKQLETELKKRDDEMGKVRQLVSEVKKKEDAYAKKVCSHPPLSHFLSLFGSVPIPLLFLPPQIVALESQIARLTDACRLASDDAAQLRAESEQKKRDLAAKQQRAATALANLQQRESALSTLTAAHAQLEKAHRELQVDMEEVSATNVRLQRLAEAQLDEEKTRAVQEKTQLLQALREVEQREAAMKAEAERADTQRSEALAQLAAAESTVAHLSSSATALTALQEQHSAMEAALVQAQQKVRELEAIDSEKIEKGMVTSLFMSFFLKPASQSTLLLMAKMLGWTEEERAQVGLKDTSRTSAHPSSSPTAATLPPPLSPSSSTSSSSSSPSSSSTASKSGFWSGFGLFRGKAGDADG
jgi:DNA repair exonuclease SbcCD ATPase subunit